MKRWGLTILFSALMSGNALAPSSAASPALELGYCGSDFDVCYNSCRINHPEASFAGDRARVICGQGCIQKRRQCEAKASGVVGGVGGAVQRAPQPIAPLPTAPQQIKPVAKPNTVPQAPTASRAPAERESSSWLDWFKPRERTRTLIPGR